MLRKKNFKFFLGRKLITKDLSLVLSNSKAYSLLWVSTCLLCGNEDYFEASIVFKNFLEVRRIKGAGGWGLLSSSTGKLRKMRHHLMSSVTTGEQEVIARNSGNLGK